MDKNEWVEITSKLVRDYDGFLTDYTMYENKVTGQYIFMFGDKDITTPDSDWADWECDSYDEAVEWFDNYDSRGYVDDDFDDFG